LFGMLLYFSSFSLRLTDSLRSRRWPTAMKNMTSVTSVRSFVQNAVTMNDEVMIGEVVNHGKTGLVPVVSVC